MKLANNLNKEDKKIKFTFSRLAPKSFGYNFLNCKLLNCISTKSAKFDKFSVLLKLQGGASQWL